MEDDYKGKRRQRASSQREKRWSMNSQRLEIILAQLMKPINDLRHCFDTDLSELLEQYLTEAGLHALADTDDDEAEVAATDLVLPNFAEVALLLQQSANIYGRKVDFLYNHVLQVSDSLQNSTLEITNSQTEEPVTPSPSRRRRPSHANPGSGVSGGQFGHIPLVRHPRAKREPSNRPPPTLPRAYMSLEPRVLPVGVEPLRDYEGEALGHVSDYQVSWRLCNGYLTNGMGSGNSSSSIRPLPLMALQAAVLANAPPEPPPLALEPPEDPPRCSTPEDVDMDTPTPKIEMPPPQPRRKKRSHSTDRTDVTVKLVVTEKLRKILSQQREFDGAAEWVERVVASRCKELLELRKQLRDSGTCDSDPFRGFDFCSQDLNGFPGWAAAEAAMAAEVTARAIQQHRLKERPRLDDSDDDGFFDLSSSCDSERSQADTAHNDTGLSSLSSSTEAEAEAAEWAAWRARVALMAQRGALAPGPDVRTLGAAVIDTLRPKQVPAGTTLSPEDSVVTTLSPNEPVPVSAAGVLATATATAQAPVSHIFLATLFLANAGNVEVIQGRPLSMGDFSLRLLNDDQRLYCTHAELDPAFKLR